MAVALEEFIKQLEDSGIVSPGKLREFMPRVQASQDTEGLARTLIAQHQLTRYQAEQLLEGRVQALLIGNYLLLEQLGAGGMGRVYKARHRQLKRLVALKVLAPHLVQDASAIKRFQREAEAAGTLIHPHIVATYDAGEDDGRHYLVMEYVEGSDLASLVRRRGRLDVDTAVGCVIQAARGLEYAHLAGVVHRDIKPANLLLDLHGTVKILDMGLARMARWSGDGEVLESLTATGNIMGTVDYMSPEQALDSKQADHRCDIYSLGCTLFYLLSGRLMYEADTVMKKLLAHREGSIPSLREIGTNASIGLDLVYRKMVAKRPEDRFQSVHEARAELEAACPDAVGSLDVTREFTPAAVVNTRGLSLRGARSKRRMVSVRNALAMAVAIGALVGAAWFLGHGVGPSAGLPGNAPDQIPLSSPASAAVPSSAVAPATGRDVLKWVVSLGGKVAIARPDETGLTVIDSHADPLPSHFQLVRVEFPSNQRLVDDDLGRLSGLSLVHLELRNTKITDRGLSLLTRLARLRSLSIGNTRITSAGLRSLLRIRGLTEINLAGGPLTDDGLACLREFGRLELLNIPDGQFTDAGLAQLRDLQLTTLFLGGPAISDQSLQQVANYGSLETLALHRTRVTEEGLTQLARLSKLRRLELLGMPLGSPALARLKMLLSGVEIVSDLESVPGHK